MSTYKLVDCYVNDDGVLVDIYENEDGECIEKEISHNT